MAYNKDTDYSEKIKEAVSGGDYKKAAEYEQSRNEKIDSEGLNYEKTNRYSGWLDNNDYGTEISNKIKHGASKNDVAGTLKKRIEKASGTDGLTQYAYDDIYDSAIMYLMSDSGFSYDKKAPSFKSTYSQKVDKLYDLLVNAGKFSYNPEKDDLYKYYRNEYRREGERAMEDTIGKLAANTGGVASSYAASAAGQAYDYYNTKLTDKIPELYKLAYDSYLDDIKTKTDNVKLASQLADDEYDRYMKMYDIYEADRDFAYKNYIDGLDNFYRRDKLDRDNFESDREYNLELDKFNETKKKNANDYDINLKRLAEEAEENSRIMNQQTYENALKKWGQLGYLDSESAEILGLPAGLETSDHRYKRAQEYKLYNK